MQQRQSAGMLALGNQGSGRKSEVSSLLAWQEASYICILYIV